MLRAESNNKMIKKEKINLAPFPELKTARLILRQLKESDSEDIYFLRSDESVNKYVVRPRAISKDDAREFISIINNGIKKNESIYWAITMKEVQQLIGTICLWNFSKDKTRAEIGFELMPEYQGKGIMNEALEIVLEFGFKSISLASIDGYVHKNNMSSIKLLKKNNFEQNTELKDSENPNNIVFTLSSSQLGENKPL